MKKRILSMILALAMVLSLGLSVVAEGEETQADIVDAAFALESGKSLEGTKTLTGEVSSVPTAYNAQNQYVTVNIHVLDGSGNTRTIQCYQMKGADAATVGVGDVITVTGTIKNYNGLIEFDKACTFVTVSKAVGDYPIKTYVGYDNYDVTLVTRLASGETTLTDILYKFKNDKYRDWNYYGIIVVGADNVVTAVYSEYGSGYSKADVEVPEGGYIIGVNGKNGDDHTADWGVFDVVAVGSTIRLFGADLEAAANVTAANTAVTGVSYSVIPAFVPPTTEEEILAAAFALEPGTALPGGPYSLTGVVNKKTDDKTQVNITVGDKDVLCYQMNADDYAAIAVGDTVIVTGNLKNYNGIVEFDTGCTAVIVPMPLFDWDEDAWVDAVIGENAGWQNPDYAPADDADPETVLAPKFQYRIEDGYFYAAALFNLPLTKGTGNGNSTFFRVWVKTAEDQLSYRYFYEVYVKTDDTLGFRAADNINGTTAGTNSPVNNTESAYSYNMIETADGVLAEIRIPLEEIGATDYLAAYLTASIEKVTGGAVQNQCLYFPALGDAHITSGTWTEEHGNIGLLLIEPVEEPEPYEATVIVADNAILTDGETGFQGAWGTVGTGD
ncbi:MAG: hypothetical protein J5547_02430, partial [Clostridia bacterium]|nr:hypothetical protein [Clostridia bacterium]